jgi:competence protein ComEC
VSQNPLTDSQTGDLPSRLILNTDTHPRIWQMWSLLCAAELPDDNTIPNHTVWLGHSTSHITTEVISQQSIDEVITYDDKGLETALSLRAIVDTVPQK